ncbi:MAG: 3'-5' DNA helicase [Geoglossum umbratile]|nr:MAG: 3'-5' DNA helicase [Geoglossum umbratile]
MGEFDEEFDEEFDDDLNDEEMILAVSQVEQQRRVDRTPQAWALPPSHANKRRRLNHPRRHSAEERDSGGPVPTGDDGGDAFPHRPIPGRENGSGPSQTDQIRDTTPDLTTELENLPSDAFASSPLEENRARGLVYISSSQPFSSQQRRHASSTSRGSFRQTTLFGGRAEDPDPPSQTNSRRNWPLVNSQEPLTHHKLDRKAMETWVFPTNLGSTRDYQFNIVQKGLFHNLLVALPTGLGKTFIAATIMLNWFRWTTESQIIFVAPTKPLVAQQVDACFGIVGIPRSQTAMLTGETPPGYRAEEWNSKRVVFLTPQTLVNDLKTGICDPKKIVCLVVDEAHRATGGYAYVQVVKFIRRFNQSFRVLALTATPGASVERVQEVIDGLDLARVEIRTEESLDTRSYVHRRKVELIPLDPSKDLAVFMDLYAKALQPLLNKLNQHNAYWGRDPRSLTTFGLLEARKKWLISGAGRNASMAVKGMMHGLFGLLSQLAHPMALLQFHGIGPFYHNLVGFRAEVEKQGKKTSKYRKQVAEDPNFQKLMSKAQDLVNNPTFMGHPKLEYLVGVVLRHFTHSENNQGAGSAPPSETRVMIFVHFRDSAEEVVRVLKRHEPMIRPTIFNGQATSKGGSVGMSQKDQLEAISKFQKGIFNTIVATSIGEEGLDIGEVDLIVCYDSSSSPVRMLQRMGRTGRKRDGNIILLLMRGKEFDSYAKANDCYEKMQEMIAKGDKFNYHEGISRRIVPRDIQPVVDKRAIEIPIENSQPEPLEPKKRTGKPPKRPPKRFFMPDGVETGFVKASHLRGRKGDSKNGVRQAADVAEEEIDNVPLEEDVLLNSQDQREHDRTYTHAFGGVLDIDHIELCAWPASQRSLGRTKFVKHGQKTVQMVKMLAEIRGIDDAKLASLEQNLHPEDREEALKVQTREADIGSQKRGQSTACFSPDRLRPQSVNTDSSIEVDEDDGDMDNFIVNDDESEDGAATEHSSTSPPPLEALGGPFYRPGRKEYLDSGSEDDLPDVSTLVRKESRVLRDVLAEKTSADNLLQPRPRSQRKGKGAIIQDTDDDD